MIHFINRAKAYRLPPAIQDLDLETFEATIVQRLYTAQLYSTELNTLSYSVQLRYVKRLVKPQERIQFPCILDGFFFLRCDFALRFKLAL